MPVDGSGALFVSPHLDDVALSCGATVAKVALRGEQPLVVTLFTADPQTAPVGELARRIHEMLEGAGTPIAQLGAARRSEDVAAMAELGAAHLWLGYDDAIYRGYDTRVALRAEPTLDAALFDRLSAAVIDLWRTARGVVYLPLGVGGHVDHRLTSALSAPLVAAGATVWHYEDFPYALEDGALERRIVELGGVWRSRDEDVTDALPRRLAAMGRYASQLPLLFRDEGGRHEEITRRFSASRGPAPGRSGERFWQRERSSA